MMYAEHSCHRGVLKLRHEEDVFNISWPLIVGVLFIWTVIGGIISRGVLIVGRYLRCMAIISAFSTVILFVRVCLLPEVIEDSARMFSLKSFAELRLPSLWITGPLVASVILGREWGMVLNLASYQPFKANIARNSYIIPGALAIVSMMFGYMLRLVDGFVGRRAEVTLQSQRRDLHEYFFVNILYFFGNLEWSQFWSILFYFTFFIGDLSSIVLQTFATVTALTDEYEHLRYYKPQVSVGICAVSFIFSCLFATKYLVYTLSQLITSGYANQMFICFLEIIVMVFIYGHMRFAQDVRFILRGNMAGWKLFILRFLVPLILILTGSWYFAVMSFGMIGEPIELLIVIIITKVVPWIVVPAYAIKKLLSLNLQLKEKIKMLTNSHSWHPADIVDKHRYELLLKTSEIIQPTFEM